VTEPSGEQFQRVAIVKAVDTPQGLTVLGWAYKSLHADGTPVVDHSGEHIPESELRYVAKQLMAMGDAGNGVMHETHGGVESLGSIHLTNDEQQALGWAPQGSGVLVKLNVTDANIAKRVRSGELAALSIEGKAIREEAAV
jgi:hypothetical protein